MSQTTNTWLGLLGPIAGRCAPPLPGPITLQRSGAAADIDSAKTSGTRPDANADALNSGRGVSRTGIKMPFSICDFNFDLLRFISNAWRSSQIKRLTRLCLIAMLSFHGTPTVSGVVSPGSGSERAGFGKSTRASTAITRRNHPAVDNSTGL